MISPYRLPQQQVEGGNDAFPVAHDLLALLGHDIPLSTAASLSARFPYLLPAGMMVDQLGRVQGRAVDGGYFENYGAVTAMELLADQEGGRFQPIRHAAADCYSDQQRPEPAE